MLGIYASDGSRSEAAAQNGDHPPTTTNGVPSNTRTLTEDLEATALSSHEASKVAVRIRLSHLHDICLLTKEKS